MKSPGTIYKKTDYSEKNEAKMMRNGDKEEEKKKEHLMAFEPLVITLFPGKVYLKEF